MPEKKENGCKHAVNTLVRYSVICVITCKDFNVN
jgi:hypothetical protein